jgi:hypothetical protein
VNSPDSYEVDLFGSFEVVMSDKILNNFHSQLPMDEQQNKIQNDTANTTKKLSLSIGIFQPARSQKLSDIISPWVSPMLKGLIPHYHD